MSARPHGISVRARLTLAMAAIAAIAFAVVALVAPNAVRRVLDEDLLVAEAETASLKLTLTDLSDFDPDDLIKITDGDFFPLDPDVLIEVGGIFDGVFDDFGGFGLDADDAEETAAETIQLLESIGRLDLLVDAAGGSFAIELGLTTGALIEPDGSFVIVDDLAQIVDEGVPVMPAAELDELIFDDLGLRQVGSGSFFESDSDGRTIAGVVEIDGLQMLVAADTAAVDRSVERVQLGLWLALPLLTAAVAALAWLLTSRALRPVASITDRAATISGGSLDARVPVPNSGDEISTLAVTVNEMLDRLEDDDRARRRFISDASHELRSPVAVMRNDAEVALRHPDTTDARELAAVVAGESSRMSAIIDDLLALARHDERVAPPTDEVDLDDIVFGEAARTRRVRVDCSRVSAGRVRGRHDELTRLVSHLLDNATRHAATSVTVELHTTATGVELVVDDDGPGVDAADRERIFERFARLDDARTRDEGGAGLGLAVVRSIAERSRGTVTADQSPTGGARFTVSFPA
jgi:signal transduction histidine kinase